MQIPANKGVIGKILRNKGLGGRFLEAKRDVGEMIGEKSRQRQTSHRSKHLGDKGNLWQPSVGDSTPSSFREEVYAHGVELDRTCITLEGDKAGVFST